MSMMKMRGPICDVFRCFFVDKISFPGQTVHFAHRMSYIFWKLLFQRSILTINKYFFSILRGVRFLLTQWAAYVNSILHCVIYKKKHRKWARKIGYLLMMIFIKRRLETIQIVRGLWKMENLWGNLIILLHNLTKVPSDANLLLRRYRPNNMQFME